MTFPFSIMILTKKCKDHHKKSIISAKGKMHLQEFLIKNCINLNKVTLSHPCDTIQRFLCKIYRDRSHTARQQKEKKIA